MKFLQLPELVSIDEVLRTGVEVEDMKIYGRLEAYSCKMASSDKKIAKEVDEKCTEQLLESGALSPQSFGSFTGTSPIGPIAESATRKLLVNLISTLNASFADYDFRTLGPNDFMRELSGDMVMSNINSSLMPVEDQHPGFLEHLWNIMNEIGDFREAEVYSYVPDMESDPLSMRQLWSFNYFIYNKKEKRMFFFAAWARRHVRSTSFDDEEERDEEEYEFVMDEEEAVEDEDEERF
uniref:Repressor of RNA polymerase III transcription n=1 Tax=Palpitomonas bilix TaxID=652834 RepID=A0A7S3CW85_9EUKA|mmetsp:Transcript_10250/g.26854  ORF Transcript_10250/g.26854 Transcript_10250/m.26854 type:complete len:237 (+) Transcript_10250:585-1295(+)|eukprot:CAMPEP_0113883320 /NCGR_PEP_ID=MMETSP0780_2-20120614/9524_1 /TAXON_ID=652834 /ORGANISM="Palpitomonas bilix" /LENGTH=236 /DNA_ID=CAMNT_0000870591 /DNA_START=236 /DNA_END=946 /DNA_ORIENTATION=- /assembly_acc=CAM_ASM_000599